MSNDSVDDLELLRQELSELGISGRRPEDFGLQFRDADSFVQPPPARTSPAVRRWLPPSLLAAAAVVLAIAILVPRIGDPGSPGSPGTSGAPDFTTVSSALQQAAAVSGRAADLSDARYWHVESYQQQGSTARVKRSVWYGNGVPGLVVDDWGPVRLPVATFGLQRTTLTWAELIALPTDPGALRSLLDRETADLSDSPWYVVKLAAELLAESPAPPSLRRALWQVIADVPGAVDRGRLSDELGRQGLALAFQDVRHGTLELVIDPEKGAILQSTITPAQAGAARFRALYVAQGPADSLPPSASPSRAGAE